MDPSKFLVAVAHRDVGVAAIRGSYEILEETAHTHHRSRVARIPTITGTTASVEIRTAVLYMDFSFERIIKRGTA